MWWILGFCCLFFYEFKEICVITGNTERRLLHMTNKGLNDIKLTGSLTLLAVRDSSDVLLTSVNPFLFRCVGWLSFFCIIGTPIKNK